MRNYSNEVIKELNAAGYQLVRRAKHGDIFLKPKRPSIMVSKNIQKYIANVFVYHGYPEFCGKYDSDHFPVVVDFIK